MFFKRVNVFKWFAWDYVSRKKFFMTLLRSFIFQMGEYLRLKCEYVRYSKLLQHNFFFLMRVVILFLRFLYQFVFNLFLLISVCNLSQYLRAKRIDNILTSVKYRCVTNTNNTMRFALDIFTILYLFIHFRSLEN